jgi:hypothetical protein
MFPPPSAAVLLYMTEGGHSQGLFHRCLFRTAAFLASPLCADTNINTLYCLTHIRSWVEQAREGSVGWRSFGAATPSLDVGQGRLFTEKPC